MALTAIKNSDIYIVNSFKNVVSHMDVDDVKANDDINNISKLHDVLREIKN